MEPVTMTEVARRAGTSPSAVSRALNGRPGVRPDVRARVLAVAKELGYSANPAARNLALGRSGMIALVVSDRDVVVGTTFFSEVVGSVVSRLDDAELQTVLLLPNAAHHRRPEPWLRLERFDGAVVIGHRKNDPVLRLVRHRDIPAVALGRPAADVAVNYVDIDNVLAARTATEHLIEQGARRLICLAGPEETSWAVDRVKGFRHALRTHDVRGHIQPCEFSGRGGRAGIEAALESMPDADAVLVSSEALLPGVSAGLRDSGRQAPDHILLATFDDSPALELSSPSITAVRQPLTDLGSELGRLLVEMLDRDRSTPSTAIILSATLEVRESSQRPKP